MIKDALQPNDLTPAVPTGFKSDAKKARDLAGKAIRDPTNLKAEDILALAFATIGLLDAKEPAARPGRP